MQFGNRELLTILRIFYHHTDALASCAIIKPYI